MKFKTAIKAGAKPIAFRKSTKLKAAASLAKNDDGINVVSVGYRGILWLALGMATWALIDWKLSGSRIDLPFWWDAVSGFIGLAGAFKISAGAFLTGKRTKALFDPQQEGHPSDHKAMVVVVSGMRDLMVSASDAAIRGTIWLLIAFLMVVGKPAVEEYAHEPIPTKPESTVRIQPRSTQPPPKGAAPIPNSASLPAAPPHDLAQSCHGPSCPR